MRRLLRWAFNLSALVSALLSVGVCVLWLRGYRHQDVRVAEAGTVQTSVSSVRGALHFLRVTTAYPRPPSDQGVEWATLPASPADTLDQRYGLRSRDLRAAGFAWIEGDVREGFVYAGEPPLPYRALVVPCWAVAALAAVVPAARFAVRRRARRGGGLCSACGYDLRATPDRCPECGAAPGPRIA